MTVRKDEPMDHLAAMDDEFDALLGASSLGAPHVVAETGDIPATARRRMAQAVRQQQRSFGMPDGTPHPQPDDEADSCPGVSTDAERTAQEVQPIPRWRPFTLLYGTNGGGKSVISAAVFAWLHSAYSDTGRGRRREPPTQRSWNVAPRTNLIRSALWLTGTLDESSREGTPRRRCISYGSPVTLPGWRHTPLLVDMAASALRSTCGEAQAAPYSTLACAQAVQLLSPDIGTRTPPNLHAWGWEGAWWHKQRLRNLRHVIEPWMQPDESLFSVTPTGLFVCAMPPTPLHIASFTNFAYTAVGSGLLLPKAEGEPRRRHPVQESGKAGRDLRQPARAGRTKLWRAVVDGAHELSAELPMSFHFDERESLALTSSLHTRLTYRVSDPYAVEARFRADDLDETVWIFARDLLRNGLERNSGLGDVIVWPDTGAQGERRIFVRLSSPEGTALLSAADADLRAFLEAASSLVAYGAEHSYLVPALNALETTIGELARPGRCE
jgi:hypothetical protein